MSVETSKNELVNYEEYLDTLLLEAGVDIEEFTPGNPEYVLSIYARANTNFKELFHSEDEYLMEIFSSFLRENPDGFSEALVNAFDFANPSKFEETGTLLTLLQSQYTHILADEEEGIYEEMTEGEVLHRSKATAAIKDCLRTAIDQEQGSYLLFHRTQEVYAYLFGEVGSQKSLILNDYFELTDGTTAYFDGKNIHLVDDKKYSDPLELHKEHDSGSISIHRVQLPDPDKREILTTELLRNRYALTASESDLQDYLFLLSDAMRSDIESSFAIQLSDLTIKEQFYFLNYLKRVTVAMSETMKQFTSLYGVDGMRTFLALERGDETLGDHIVAFGQHDEVAGTVFQYYGELLNNSEKAESLVQETGCEGEYCVQLAEQVRENIINRAQKDLETAVRAHDPSEVAAKIETYVADAKVYVALLQEAVHQPLESIPATEISEGDKEQIRALSARNYMEESENFQGVIRSGLEFAFESGDTRFYIERDDSGKVIFCDRFDDKVDPYNGRTVKYFGSVNAEPAFNGIGRVRITETLEQELANGETMFAHCDPENAVSSLYIEHGFVATGIVSPAGKFSFEIWRSSDSSEQLQTKGLSTAELLDQFEIQSESNGYEIRKVELGDQFPELSEGKYLTRYFKHNNEYYAVFEPAPAALEAEFVPPQEQKEAA